ncbi:hypothetical protein GQ53DRAFT_837748 [Thozetella sp. PMI_491]|nr:hypothetical protein GQ53DRAFT_837748 [Thozetella sp. PMI_491]
MTSDSANPIYPQYCFCLSPTINRWCHLRASDIHALTCHPGFEGQNLFFHLNHPMKWVRIAGVVVAIDEYAHRKIYTVDDSSGSTIECVVTIPKPPEPADATNKAKRGHFVTAKKQKNAENKAGGAESTEGKEVPIDGDIDVGHILDVKGGLKVFRDMKQVHAEKIVHLRSTQQEVQFWNKVAELRRDILSKPWVLDRREVRRCRKEAEGRDRKTHGRKASHSSGKENRKAERRVCPMTTGLERGSKLKRLAQIEGHYDALGI